jgi:hypothetical protein
MLIVDKQTSIPINKVTSLSECACFVTTKWLVANLLHTAAENAPSSTFILSVPKRLRRLQIEFGRAKNKTKICVSYPDNAKIRLILRNN